MDLFDSAQDTISHEKDSLSSNSKNESFQTMSMRLQRMHSNSSTEMDSFEAVSRDFREIFQDPVILQLQSQITRYMDLMRLR